jgi:methylated-DNA-[protein]-cysteine S-methyltransferase
VVRGQLQRRDLEQLRSLAAQDSGVYGTVVALLLDPDVLIRWRAVEALGLLAADAELAEPGKALDLVRRQFWSMTDESGNIPWHAPEAIGEILYRVPELAHQFLFNLAAYGEIYPFFAGVFWALSRLAEHHRALVLQETDRLLRALEHEEPAVRGHAAAALGVINAGEATEALRSLTDDAAELDRYDFESGELKRITVGAVAQAALQRIR